ncbi:hypothetical protein EYR40_003114 [Pleurotus pulmonarius]|nr:hypothetical protein EYR40_003114 [Pleurotus pulmonarius]
MLATLPPEMQEAIFKHMDDEQALLNVMLASHHFFQMAEPILYTHICLRSTSFRRATSASRSDRLRSLLDALLVSDGKRANYVRALAFPLIQITDELALVGKVLTTTVNLKALRLRIHILSYQFHTRLIPSQFTLTCLHVECPMLISEMQHFLESQTWLETLHLQLATVPTLAVSRTVFSSTSFPNLKTLIANLNLIPAFLLTSACVQNLRVIAHEDDLRVEDTVRMTSVRLFSCRPEYARRSRASQLPNLEWLETRVVVCCYLLVLFKLTSDDIMSSPLKLGAISIKNQTRRNVDHATRNDFSGNIAEDVPLEDFVTALFSISENDITNMKSRTWDMIDDCVSNYRRMVQKKAHESKLYPFFQRILIKLGQEVTEEDLAFVVRVSGTDELKNKYTSRKPDGSIWWGTVELVWHLMKAAIEMKRRKQSSHCDGGTQAQTMPDIAYETEARNRSPAAGPSTLCIPTIPEIPATPANPSTPPPNATTELPASPSTPPPNTTTNLLPVLLDASSNEAPSTVLESRVTPPVHSEASGDATTDLPSFDRPINTVVGAEIVLPCDIAKPSKQDPRFVITAPPLYVYRGVVGRGSIVYPVRALNDLSQNRELVAKWSWPLAVRKREHELIDLLRRLVPFMQQHLPEVLEHKEYSMEELGLPRDPKQPRRLPTHPVLQEWECDNYRVNASRKNDFQTTVDSRLSLFAAVQPAFRPLIEGWLDPLLNLFGQARFYALLNTRKPDFDGDTLGGFLTFENFMSTIGAVPREVPAEFKKDG